MPSLLGRTSIFNKLTIANEGDFIYTVCVKPNEFGTYDDSLVKFTSSRSLPVYTYDKAQNLVGGSLHMSIPSWIVKNTFTQLEKRDTILSELRETLRVEDSRVKMKHGAGEEEIYSETRRPQTLERRRKFTEQRSTESTPVLHRIFTESRWVS
jgi:hypothetical protein